MIAKGASIQRKRIGTGMKDFLVAAAVVVIVLTSIDLYFFGGRYVSSAHTLSSRIVSSFTR